MIYSTASARFIHQLNMSFIRYFLFWNCRYIAQCWKPFVNRLWQNKWKCERRFDLSKSCFFPHMHLFFIYQETVTCNVCMTCSRESIATGHVLQSNNSPIEVFWGWGWLFTQSPGQPLWNPFRLWLNWHESKACFCFFSTQHPWTL